MAITQEEMLKIKESAKKAEESERPFPILKDGELAVVGDVNDIELKPHDYTVTFSFPDEMGIEGEHKAGRTLKDVEYKNIYVTPQDSYPILRNLMELMPLFNKINEDGSLTERTEEELAEVLEVVNDQAVDTCYNIVARFLKVDESLVPYMQPVSVFATVARLIRDNEASWNEADVFFG